MHVYRIQSSACLAPAGICCCRYEDDLLPHHDHLHHPTVDAADQALLPPPPKDDVRGRLPRALSTEPPGLLGVVVVADPGLPDHPLHRVSTDRAALHPSTGQPVLLEYT